MACNGVEKRFTGWIYTTGTGRIAYEEPSIGRVVTSPKVRQTGIGKLLMQYSIRTSYNAAGENNDNYWCAVLPENSTFIGFSTVQRNLS